jgi:hypothetical protein
MKPEDKAVVQQALEFLEMISPQFPPLVYTETDRKRDEASTALRQLLEQSEQEPDEWLTGCPECGMDSGCDCDSGTWNPPAQSADHADELTIAYLDGVHTGKKIAKREWVGLTDEERWEVTSKKWWDWEDEFDIEGFARAIEAKLREKNGGGA